VPDIFLSYSREDQTTARQFAEGLQRAGFSVWWDQALKAGEAFDEVTEKALDEARAVVVLWSKASVSSRWVRAEATQANAGNRLVPVMIEPCKRPIMFELTHTVELTGWNGDDADPAWRTLVADLQRLVGAVPPEAVRQDVVEPQATVAARPSSTRIVIPLLMLLLIGGGGAWWSFAHHVTGTQSQPAATPSAPISLAVLPFVDLSEAHDQEYFSDGLTEEILNQLAQIPALRVAGRTSSFSFKGRNEDLREIARQLGVENLLEGSVRKEGDRVRITAQLINGHDGTHRWSHAYEQALSGVFELQEDVARDVAQALSITLDVGVVRREEGGTTNPDAYDLYLKARQALLQGSREGSQRAVPLLREAVARDEDFALAWRDLAMAIRSSMVGMSVEQSRPANQEFAAAMARAVSLAPHTWWAKLGQVSELVRQHEWADAEQLLVAQRGDAPLSAANLDMNLPYGNLLFSLGRVGELIRMIQQEIQIDPQSLLFTSDLQMNAIADPAYFTLAEQEYQRSLGLVGDHQRVQWARYIRLVASRDSTPAQIRQQFGRVLETQNLPMKLFPQLAPIVNDKAAVLRVLRAALDEPENADATRMQVLAITADAYGNKDLAWTWLARYLAATHNDLSILWLLPASGVRADPRFKALVRQVKLDDYWRNTGHWGDFCKPVGDSDFECH
jgi:TolB-like protein